MKNVQCEEITILRNGVRVCNKDEELEKITPIQVDGLDGFYYFPDNNKISVSRDGEIKNLRTGKTLKHAKGKDGRLNIGLRREDGRQRSYKVHRVLARTFIGRPLRHQNTCYTLLEVNHRDGNVTNNCLTNLEWVNSKENTLHAHESNLISSRKEVLGKNVITGEIIHFKGIRALAKALDIHHATLFKHLNSKNAGRYQACGMVFKFNDGSEWPILDAPPVDFNISNNLPRTFIIKDKLANKFFIMEGFSNTAKFIKKGVATVFRHITKTGIYEDENFLVSVKD